MNNIYLCLGCMTNKGIEEVCPYCGFDPNKYEDDMMVLPLATILNDRYLIGKSIGCGGFGITYLAWDQTLEVAMAIKEYLPSNLAIRTKNDKSVKPNHQNSEKSFHYYMDRFLEEARMLAQFNDEKGIVSVQDVFKENGTIYIVMYYINGIDLERYLMDKGGKLPPKEALKIMKIVMDSLSKVHENGLIHRDISPDNIYITSDKQVKLLDFGASRYTIGEGEKTLSVIMKRGYAPLEQYTAKGKQGPWTDVYSAAATLYKLMTGTKPEEPLDRMDDDLLKSPKALGVSIDFHVDIAIMKALELRPENRFQTMKEFLEALEGHEPLITQIEKPIRIQKTHNNKPKIRTLVLGVVGFLLLVGISYAMIAMNPKTPQESANEPGQDISENLIEDQPQPTVISNEIKLGIENEINQDETFILDNMIGMDYLEVFNILNSHGLELTIKEEQYNEKHPEGVVIHQSLASGTPLKKDDQIQVILSKGSAYVNIPVLKGQSLETIIKFAEESDFDLDLEMVQTDAYEPGIIISQDPDSTKVTRGTNIIVQVSEPVLEPVQGSDITLETEVPSVPVESEEPAETNIETELVPTEPPIEETQNLASETTNQEISQDKTRIIKDWLVQIPSSDLQRFQTRVIKDKLPDHLKEVDFISVWGHDNITPALVQDLLEGPINIYNFHEYKEDYMAFNSSGEYYNYHLITMGKDDTVLMYAAIYPDGSVEFNDQVRIPLLKKVDLSIEANDFKTRLLNAKTYVFKEGDRTLRALEIQEEDQDRSLPFGLEQSPNYLQNNFTTTLIRKGLPQSLVYVNQMTVIGFQGTMDEFIESTYERLAWGETLFTKPSIFGSTGAYYHDHMVALLEDDILKAVVRITLDGTITYKYLQ